GCNTLCRTPSAGPQAVQLLTVIIPAPPGALDQMLVTAVQTPPVNPAASGNPRTIHSVAVSTGGLVFLPIPAVGGVNTTFGATLCDVKTESVTLIGTAASSATGCIAILAPAAPPGSAVAKARVSSPMQR